jgi:hypothetical protein
LPAPQGNPLGAGKWLQAGDGGDGGRVWLQYGAQLAPLMVMSDFDDASRIQFQQTGSGTEEAPQFSSWIGLAGPNSPDMALFGGRVGIGTLAPQRTLHVESEEVHSGGAGGGFSFANRGSGFVNLPAAGERWVLYATGGVARLWSGEDKLSIDTAGNLRFGLGPIPRYHAVGSPDNVRLVSGRVNENGPTVGTDWFVTHMGTGIYLVSFTVPFTAIPVVTATLVDPLSEDNVICVRNVAGNGFTCVVRDIDSAALDGSTPQNSAFNFIAVGPRA